MNILKAFNLYSHKRPCRHTARTHKHSAADLSYADGVVHEALREEEDGVRGQQVIFPQLERKQVCGHVLKLPGPATQTRTYRNGPVCWKFLYILGKTKREPTDLCLRGNPGDRWPASHIFCTKETDVWGISTTPPSASCTEAALHSSPCCNHVSDPLTLKPFFELLHSRPLKARRRVFRLRDTIGHLHTSFSHLEVGASTRSSDG